mmetsp:Transcript_110476/g.236070  ORF Transcript_110476/g.236070 Transcript_110476/m.236070 type:complete len:290 (+) Transcript_110476:152-1021(+)
MAQAGCSDIVLILSLIYLSVDLQFDWDGFRSCHRPVHQWLLGSYVIVMLSRLVYLAGSMLATTAEAGDFLLDLRPKGSGLRLLSSLTWLVIVPFFALWSLIGTSWIWDVRRYSPQCLPSGVHLWFLIIWQVLSYLWILIHCGLGVAAWLLERRLRNAEGDLQQIEALDSDVQSRWGQVSRLSDYTSLEGLSGAAGRGAGLSPSQIRALPSFEITEGNATLYGQEDCPICLNALQIGDSVRQLDACEHTYHCACIDLWLLRRADCPLCKQKVSGGSCGGGGCRSSTGWAV